MPTSTQAPSLPAKILWLARLENPFHAQRGRRARRRGLSASIVPFPGYGGVGWVRVVGRVLIVRPPRDTQSGEISSLRGWRSFVSIPVGYSEVKITVAGRTHTVVSDRGGVVDTVIEAELEPGWQTVDLSVEGCEPVEARVFIVGADVTFGVVSDVDDTVMVTALPRPLIAAWNSFVVDEHAHLVALPATQAPDLQGAEAAHHGVATDVQRSQPPRRLPVERTGEGAHHRAGPLGPPTRGELVADPLVVAAQGAELAPRHETGLGGRQAGDDEVVHARTLPEDGERGRRTSTGTGS